MLIGLNGRLRSGKDTTYQIIKEICPHAERVAFADKLKQSAAGALGATVEAIERCKANPDVRFLCIDHTGSLVPDVPAFTMRELLQRYGTEAHRDVFGTDFWVDMALPLNLDHSDRLVCVTDLRFPNEADRVHQLGGVVVKVVRPIEAGFGGHSSEQNIDHLVDRFLSNEGTIDDLRRNVDALMDSLYFRAAVA